MVEKSFFECHKETTKINENNQHQRQFNLDTNV